MEKSVNFVKIQKLIMKQFFGAFFGSIVGMIVATLIAVVLVVVIITSSIKSAISKASEKEELTSVLPNSILKIRLSGPIEERGADNPLEDLDLGPLSQPSNLGLNTTIRAILKAKGDSRIQGIYLEVGNLSGGYADYQELRNALISFRGSGKFIYAYSEGYGQAEYYLASSASDVFLHPQGSLEWKGLSMQLMFYKPALEKLNIDVQVFRHGKFKSAIEPYLLDKMSDANRVQGEKFLNSIWQTMVSDIATSRQLNPDSLQYFADHLCVGLAQEAFDKKLVDRLAYEDEVLQNLRQTLKLDKEAKINFTGLNNYLAQLNENSNSDKIAVIYANGEINSGTGDESSIGSVSLVKAIHEARKDDKVKAIVLRVNSPGGSALASDVIWREAYLANKTKPLIVSMGNYAASGGYYISCPATRIFADANTITGSIGVFGVIPNIQKALSQHLGVNIDTVNTNKHSDGGGMLRGADEKEKQVIQNSIESIYNTFITKVAEGRKTTPALIDSVGQGRVWSGRDAIEIGLVDELGGLQEAIAAAAKTAKLKEFELLELPRMRDAISKLLGKKDRDSEEAFVKKQLGGFYEYYKQLQGMVSTKEVQAKLPFQIIIR